MYRSLHADRIIETAITLRARISERFRESSLSKVCDELINVAERTEATTDYLGRPLWAIRIATYAASALLIAAIAYAATRFHIASGGEMEFDRIAQAAEASINLTIILGTAIVFLVTAEVRIKRNRALKGLHELRSLAHIVDMHQLTKDPHRITTPVLNTHSSPERKMTRFELGRYLDYSSEMLSLIAKLSALYAQSCDDRVVLETVDSIEDLTVGLSQKIWQKVRMLHSEHGPEHGCAPAADVDE